MPRVVDHAAVSDVGRVRRANEDSFLEREPLFVVADGMGGAQAGEVASGLAIEAFGRPLDETSEPEPRMADAVRRANVAIHEQSTSHDEYKGMGTTITALLLGEDELTIAHVGDSRAYRLRDGELTRLTRDHSLVGEMVRRGAITEAEAEIHPQRSILTRALGPERDVEIDTLSHATRPGDVYLLCSDGLTGMVSEATIAEQMGSGAAMRQVAENLIAEANRNGGVDNITVVAVRLDAAGEPGEQTPGQTPQDDGETIVAPAVVPGPPMAAAPATAAAASAPAPQTAAATNGSAAAAREASSSAAYDRRRESTGKSRRWVGGVVALVVILLAIGGAIVGSLNVYFIGGNEKGLVTVYRGLPYDLPLSVSLYTRDYVTSTPVSELPPNLRQHILDHKLRSRADALDLAQQIESGKINTQDVGLPKSEGGGSTGN
jgi:protein phosphatase